MCTWNFRVNRANFLSCITNFTGCSAILLANQKFYLLQVQFAIFLHKIFLVNQEFFLKSRKLTIKNKN
jgi:hypothetical protein